MERLENDILQIKQSGSCLYPCGLKADQTWQTKTACNELCIPKVESSFASCFFCWVGGGGGVLISDLLQKFGLI